MSTDQSDCLIAKQGGIIGNCRIIEPLICRPLELSLLPPQRDGGIQPENPASQAPQANQGKLIPFPLQHKESCDKSLSMIGTIRTKEKCPRCNGKFQKEPLHCQECGTVPRRYFVDFYWKKQHKLYSDQDGYPLTSWDQALRLLTHIRYQIDRSIKSGGEIAFDPRDYVRGSRLALQFGNYVQAWLEERLEEVGQGRLSKGYLKSVESYLRNYLVPGFGSINIREIDDRKVEEFFRELPKRLKPKTVFNIIGILRKILRDAHRRRDIAQIPYFPRLELDESEILWLDEEDQARILEHLDNPMHRAYYLFMMKQGCRPGEARALRWERIDFRRSIVTIAAAMDLETYRERTKERDIRVLPLHPEVETALKALTRDLSGFVFAHEGKPIKAFTLYRLWKKVASKVGINVAPYQGTRHSAATQAINAGVDHKVIQKMLGHKDPRSTDKYARLLTERLKSFWKRDNPQTIPRDKKRKAKLLKFDKE